MQLQESEALGVTSRQNPLIKQLRKLHNAKERSRQQRLLLEGTHLLEAALQTHYPLETVCFTDHWRSRHPHLWQQLTQAATDPTTDAVAHPQTGPRLIQVSDQVLASLTTTPHPDGIVAAARRHPPSRPPNLSQSPCSLGILLETLQDPGNLGTIIRTAAATEVEGLWLSPDSVGYDHPKVLRASVGQWFRLPFGVADQPRLLVEQAKAAGLRVVATQPGATQTHWDLDWCQPSLILLGNEGAGLSAELAALADEAVAIPLAPGVESLNAAIALAVILYEAQRQRRRSAG